MEIYRSTVKFPKEEIYGLTSQLRRAASSISANIAEGCGRDSDADFGRFLIIAYGSSSEIDYHLILARDLEYLNLKTYETLASQLNEIQRMLGSLIRKIKSGNG